MPLVMVSGLSGVKEEWEELPLLLGEDREVAVFDNRFVCASWRKDAPPYVWRDQVDAVADLVTHLGLQRYAVAGISMGGFIAQGAAAAAGPGGAVAGLVLMSTARGRSGRLRLAWTWQRSSPRRRA